MESNIEFNGSAFTTAAIVSAVAYGLYAFTTRGNNQNQNQNQYQNQYQYQYQNQYQRNNNNNSRIMPQMNNNYRRYGGKKTKKNES